MPEAKLKVQLLDSTKKALSIIYTACRQCYSQEFAADIIKSKKTTKKQKQEFVRKIVSSGHESPLEHVKFTFAIKGVSRALTHQLVRHRLASYSQQSQRYVKESNFDYIIPPSILADSILKKEFTLSMKSIQKSYNTILSMLNKKGKSGERANEDARFVLPQSAETKIVVTMNARELIHFFKHRCCARAQWEIQHLANNMLSICKKTLPEVFSKAGARCVHLKYCPEGIKFSCGRYSAK